MSKDGLELFFDMDKLKDIPVRPDLVWDELSTLTSEQWSYLLARIDRSQRMSYDEVESSNQGAMSGALLKQYENDRNPTLRSRIKVQRDAYNKELEKLKEIEKLLDENPALEKFQDLVSRTRL